MLPKFFLLLSKLILAQETPESNAFLSDGQALLIKPMDQLQELK